ncbi:MAG: energy transducer TonB [Balneolaceae bacterium]|nr:energy transducer TonB [Balneolaceae bacterium]
MFFIEKKPKADLRRYYTLLLEIGLILVLVLFILATKLEIRPAEKEVDVTQEQEIVQMEDIVQTQQEERPPPPPRPSVPVAVPNDEVIADEILNIDAELNISESLDLPPPPPSKEEEQEDEEENFFVVVEEMPELIGGLVELQKKINYPEKARHAQIEGRVIIQFIVNEKGEVENPRVVRGIGGGCDKEALRVVKNAKFKPGRQRGIPVRVQYSLPIIFRLHPLN